MAEEVKGSVDLNQTHTQDEGGTTEKTYTEAEVQALLQSEADRRVSSALKKQQKEFETKMAEAEKLKAMDETQRRDYEYSQRLQQLEAKEREFALAQNKLEATKIMASRGLPVTFVDYIVADDAETMMDNITNFERVFKSAVADEVAKKISSPAPKVGSIKQSTLTKEQFRKLGTIQRMELKQSNPELYNSLRQ